MAGSRSPPSVRGSRRPCRFAGNTLVSLTTSVSPARSSPGRSRMVRSSSAAGLAGRTTKSRAASRGETGRSAMRSSGSAKSNKSVRIRRQSMGQPGAPGGLPLFKPYLVHGWPSLQSWLRLEDALADAAAGHGISAMRHAGEFRSAGQRQPRDWVRTERPIGIAPNRSAPSPITVLSAAGTYCRPFVLSTERSSTQGMTIGRPAIASQRRSLCRAQPCAVTI